MKINQNVVDDHLMIKVINNDEFKDICNSEVAYSYALNNDMDLVCVNDQVNPAICKIYNIKKKEYDLSKSKKKQSNTKCKTIQLSSNISDNDRNYRIKNAIKFLNKGFSVKVILLIKGIRTKIDTKSESIEEVNNFLNEINKKELIAKYSSIPVYNMGNKGNTVTAIIINK